jgi:D-aminoacyl-tRNA deacylase
MKFTIIISKKDTASLNIYEELKKLKVPNIKVIQCHSIDSDYLDKDLNTDFIIFASKHSSKSLKKTLTVHSIGNFGKAIAGGEDNKLPPTSAAVQKELFLELKKRNNLDYEVSGEATHHGPYLETPSIFIEIGSSQLQWKDKEAANVIAKTIKSIIKKHIPKYKTAIGLGGGHYLPSFNKVLERTNISLSFICPKHNLQSLTEDLLHQAISQTKESIDFILLDWKGLGQEKDKTNKLLKNIDIPVKRVKEILNNEEFSRKH